VLFISHRQNNGHAEIATTTAKTGRKVTVVPKVADLASVIETMVCVQVVAGLALLHLPCFGSQRMRSMMMMKSLLLETIRLNRRESLQSEL